MQDNLYSYCKSYRIHRSHDQHAMYIYYNSLSTKDFCVHLLMDMYKQIVAILKEEGWTESNADPNDLYSGVSCITVYSYMYYNNVPCF